MHIHIYIYIYIYTHIRQNPEKGEVLLRGVGALRYASVQSQPDVLTIRINKWFLEAGSLGAPPISFKNLYPTRTRLPYEITCVHTEGGMDRQTYTIVIPTLMSTPAPTKTHPMHTTCNRCGLHHTNDT